MIDAVTWHVSLCYSDNTRVIMYQRFTDLTRVTVIRDTLPWPCHNVREIWYTVTGHVHVSYYMRDTLTWHVSLPPQATRLRSPVLRNDLLCPRYSYSSTLTSSLFAISSSRVLTNQKRVLTILTNKKGVFLNLDIFLLCHAKLNFNLSSLIRNSF